MAEDEGSIIKVERKVNGVDIVVFIRDVTDIIIKSKTFVAAFLLALEKYLSKIVSVDIPKEARFISVTFGHTIGEIKLGWREAKIDLDICTLQLIADKYSGAKLKAMNDQSIDSDYREELIRRLSDQFFMLMDKYSEPT